MYVYISIYCLSLFFSFCYSKSKDRNLILFFSMMTFLVIFIPLAFRCNIGTDYKNYVDIISTSLKDSNYNCFEIGWVPILWGIATFNLDIHIFFVLPALLSVLILFVVIPRKVFWVCIPAYISIAYLESYSLVRQNFAGSLFLLSVKAFYERKNIRALLWFIVTVSFHKSFIILVPLFFLSFFSWNVLNGYKKIVIYLLSCIFFSLFDITSFLMKRILVNSIYAGYIGSNYDVKAEMGSGLGILLRLIMIIVLLSFIKRPAENISGNKIVARSYVFTVFALMALACAHILATQIHIFNRIPNLFSPFYVNFILALVYSKSRYKRIALLFVLIALFVLFIKTLLISSSSLGQGLGIIPYSSIFER